MSEALDNKVTIFPPKLCRNICSRHEHSALSRYNSNYHFLTGFMYQDYFNFKLITLLAQDINLSNLSDIKINQLKRQSFSV